MPLLPKPKCSLCFWFDQEHESLKDVIPFYGYCRKNDPILYQVEKQWFGAWPLVDVNDFCGNFSVGGKKC